MEIIVSDFSRNKYVMETELPGETIKLASSRKSGDEFCESCESPSIVRHDHSGSWTLKGDEDKLERQLNDHDELGEKAPQRGLARAKRG
jgi:hypothetical protein